MGLDISAISRMRPVEIPEDIKLEILSGISEALSEDISLDQICNFLGISSRTIQRWNRFGLADSRAGSKRFIPRKLTLQEEIRSLTSHALKNSETIIPMK